jgi:hypothetical protein
LRARHLAFLAWLAAAGCAQDLVESDPLVVLDAAFFRCRVQPILAKDCGQLACHGDDRRYLKVYSRNRLRRSTLESERNAAFLPEERDANFANARAFVRLDAPAKSLLLLKPLDETAGGAFHRGAEIFGAGDVFLTTEDPDYQVILQWIEGATEDPACVEPGSNL